MKRKFKSYYVVWKHGNAKQGITYTVSLNRTM